MTEGNYLSDTDESWTPLGGFDMTVVESDDDPGGRPVPASTGDEVRERSGMLPDVDFREAFSAGRKIAHVGLIAAASGIAAYKLLRSGKPSAK